MIVGKRERLEGIAKALLEYETLDRSQVCDIIDKGYMSNPPTSGSGGAKARTQPPPVPETTTVAPEYPTGLSEAPA